jgi:hypothetical protein
MPDIISSKDPEGTMLKCAEAHNLSPAQLEKLGQTFNTAKTIVGLEKQANRGDSFKIVDVPSLISKYATYSPEKTLSNKSKKVHEKVDSLFDDADGWGACLTTTKSASALPDLSKLVFDQIASGTVDDTDQEEMQIDISDRSNTWQWNKSASTKSLIEGTYEMGLAQDTIDQLLFEIPMEITEKCASIKYKLTPDDGRWAEAAEDITDILGEKSAAVIATVEEYFENVHHSYDTYEDFSKRAFTRNLACDRHGIIKLAKEIAELQDMLEKVAAPQPVVIVPTPAAQPAAPAQAAPVVVPAAAPVVVPAAAPATPPNVGQPRRRNRNRAQAQQGNAPATGGNSVPSNTNDDKEAPKKSKEEEGEDYTPKPVEDITALIDAMSANKFALEQDDILNTKPVKELETLLNYIGPKSDARAKTIDKAIRQAQMDTTLQQLMLSDDVISEADPAEVRELFNTLASVSPTLATDPGKMGPALKEALQYGSVPVNILADVSKLEGQLLSNDLARANVERNKYSL